MNGKDGMTSITGTTIAAASRLGCLSCRGTMHLKNFSLDDCYIL